MVAQQWLAAAWHEERGAFHEMRSHQLLPAGSLLFRLLQGGRGGLQLAEWCLAPPTFFPLQQPPGALLMGHQLCLSVLGWA